MSETIKFLIVLIYKKISQFILFLLTFVNLKPIKIINNKDDFISNQFTFESDPLKFPTIINST
jgi:hypothetical protein